LTKLKLASNSKQAPRHSDKNSSYHPPDANSRRSEPAPQRAKEWDHLSRILEQMMKNITTQSEVNTALANRLLDLEKRIAGLEAQIGNIRQKY
jgi:small-conductance mechanosensitive channel